MAVNEDIETITGEPGTVTLVSGTKVEVQRLKTRGTMKLLKIITAGASDALFDMGFSTDLSTEDFTAKLIGAVAFSIPEAQDETVDFIKFMVQPKGLVEHPRLARDIESNEQAILALRDELEDPELEDLVSIVEAIIVNEAPHIRALGNRLAVLLKAQKLSTTAKQSASSKNASKD